MTPTRPGIGSRRTGSGRSPSLSVRPLFGSQGRSVSRPAKVLNRVSVHKRGHMGSIMQRSLGMALALGLLTVGFALGFPPAVVQPGALFVTNASNGAGDLAIQARLGALGYQVTSVLDSTTGGQDAAGKAIVVISASASAFNVGVKFKGVTTPVLVCQSGSFNNMGMTGSVSGTDYGTSANQTSLTISNPAHPMAAGLNGLQTVVSSAQTFSWGAPAGAAVIVATNAGHSAIFCFDTGAQMASGLTA